MFEKLIKQAFYLTSLISSISPPCDVKILFAVISNFALAAINNSSNE